MSESAALFSCSCGRKFNYKPAWITHSKFYSMTVLAYFALLDDGEAAYYEDNVAALCSTREEQTVDRCHSPYFTMIRPSVLPGGLKHRFLLAYGDLPI